MIFQDYIQNTVLCCYSIEVINNQQTVCSQFAKMAMVSAESCIGSFVFVHIISKVHIYNIILQITGVGDVQNVGVFFVIFLRIGFCQFAFTNTGDTLNEHLSL